jgi:hypothetical protein
MLACYLTREMGRRFIKNIYWKPFENKFEFQYFNFFGFTKRIEACPAQITRLEKPQRWDSTIFWRFKEPIGNYKLLSTRGTGVWTNKELFEFLVSKK